MERPLVTAVTHSTSEARITLTGLPDVPGIAGSGAHRAGRGERQRGHDHPERARQRGPPRRHVVHGPARRPAPRRARRSSRSRTSSASARSRRTTRMGKVSRGRRGNEEPSRRGREDASRCSARPGVNIEMISTSPIKISCVVREEHVETAVRAASHRLRASARTPCCPRTSPASTAQGGELRRGRRRGRHRRRGLDDARRACASARSPPTRWCRSPPSARPAARIDYGDRELDGRGAGRRDDPGLRPRAVLGRLGVSAEWAPALCRRRRGRGRQLVAAGACTTTSRWWSLRSTPMRSRATTASSPTRTARPCRRWWRSARSCTRRASSAW